MTSSLVGSEMCIRDSGKALILLLLTRRLRQLGPQRGLAISRKLRRWPVSYTHLTLPTICSV
eukprot:11664949-Prorocentrum_lima.AAC.1